VTTQPDELDDFADCEPPKDNYFSNFDYNNDVSETDPDPVNLDLNEGSCSFVHRFYSFLETSAPEPDPEPEVEPESEEFNTYNNEYFY
jgi:hypothetical protein